MPVIFHAGPGTTSRLSILHVSYSPIYMTNSKLEDELGFQGLVVLAMQGMDICISFFFVSFVSNGALIG